MSRYVRNRGVSCWPDGPLNFLGVFLYHVWLDHMSSSSLQTLCCLLERFFKQAAVARMIGRSVEISKVSRFVTKTVQMLKSASMLWQVLRQKHCMAMALLLGCICGRGQRQMREGQREDGELECYSGEQGRQIKGSEMVMCKLVPCTQDLPSSRATLGCSRSDAARKLCLSQSMSHALAQMMGTWDPAEEEIRGDHGKSCHNGDGLLGSCRMVPRTASTAGAASSPNFLANNGQS